LACALESISLEDPLRSNVVHGRFGCNGWDAGIRFRKRKHRGYGPGCGREIVAPLDKEIREPTKRRNSAVNRLLATFGLAALCLAPLAVRAADRDFTDHACPTASQPVREFNTVSSNPDTPVDQVIAAANHVIEIYKECGAQLQSNTTGSGSSGRSSAGVSSTAGAEGLHYAQVREAQFYFAIGHIQRVLGNNFSARDALQMSLDLVKETIDWKSPSQIYYRSNDVNIGSGSSLTHSDVSNYHEAAVQIRAAANAEMAKLPKSAGGTQ
jgi:hypothetical protein